MRLRLNTIYKVSDDDRTFYVKVKEELSNWEYDYNTYMCSIISAGDYFNQSLILVTEFWTVVEASELEIELL